MDVGKQYVDINIQAYRNETECRCSYQETWNILKNYVSSIKHIFNLNCNQYCYCTKLFVNEYIIDNLESFINELFKC